MLGCHLKGSRQCLTHRKAASHPRRGNFQDEAAGRFTAALDSLQRFGARYHLTDPIVLDVPRT